MKRKLSDVLWEAANRLNPERIFCGANQFTCVIVAQVVAGRRNISQLEADCCPGVRFLRELGCPEVAISVWGSVPKSEIQGIRYMWLLLAMHVAEDEGIMVEVAE